jgi:ergothioneine biosynthesis protein EgtB
MTPTVAHALPAPHDRAAWRLRYLEIREQTEALCYPLKTEDFVIQAIPEASPAKWHLAHTSWFFETFLLGAFAADYRPFDSRYTYLFNSYYETVGAFFPRSQRGLLSRPTVQEIHAYRDRVDEAMAELIEELDDADWQAFRVRLDLGLHHEQQHQELLLTDVKSMFALNPLQPLYQAAHAPPARPAPPLGWQEFTAGIREIGHQGGGFAYDNEAPRHRVYLDDFRLATRLVTNGEYLAFMADHGYERPELWLSDGWRACKERTWMSPLYWQKIGATWWHMTLAGLQRVNQHAPVCHVSYFEADAYARWAGMRLPTEAEWETAASGLEISGNLRETDYLQPAAAAVGDRQYYGDAWEWTQSAYAPYPGFRQSEGALGEYNGKFMISQQVLRGGSCVTPQSHIRATYRNFFYPPDRWQFTGLRLANDGA